MRVVLSTISGIFWILAYLFIIKQSFKDKTYGMPLAALGANIAWEFIFAFIHPHSYPQRFTNMVWFGLDLVIAYQFFKYGKKEFKSLSSPAFYVMSSITFVVSFLLVLLITYELPDFRGIYTAFGQNLMMSILFISMLVTRGNLRGQSLSIAVAKMIGTAAASLSFYLHFHEALGVALLPFLYLSILFFDGVYVALLYRLTRKNSKFIS